jgi:hypothetical protein
MILFSFESVQEFPFSRPSWRDEKILKEFVTTFGKLPYVARAVVGPV